MSSILQLSLSNYTPTHTLSSSHSIHGPTHLFLTHKLSLLTLTTSTPHTPTKNTTIIRMGGGPRTFPGGVSKWQWKRMQAKKSKQLLKARLARERQIYEMRKRAELKAAVFELEKPWEVVEKAAPTLFSARADEQVKVLADRFQKAGGFDLWCEKDGPQLFETVDGGISTRFFPKGVVHSVKPYGRIGEDGGDRNGRRQIGDNNLGGDGGNGSGRVSDNGRSEREGYRRIGDNFEGDGELSGNGSGRVLDNGRTGRNGHRRIGDNFGGDGGSGRVLDNGRSGRRGYRRNDGNSDEDDGELNLDNGYGRTSGGRNWSRRIQDGLKDSNDELDLGLDLESGEYWKTGVKRNEYSKISRNVRSGYVRNGDRNGEINRIGNEDSYNGTFRRKGNGRRLGLRDSKNGSSNQEESGRTANGRRSGFGDSRSGRFNQEESGSNRAIPSSGGRFSRGKVSRKIKTPDLEVFDMSLQNDGSYEFSDREHEISKE